MRILDLPLDLVRFTQVPSKLPSCMHALDAIESINGKYTCTFLLTKLNHLHNPSSSASASRADRVTVHKSARTR